jgi:hypothetical protein
LAVTNIGPQITYYPNLPEEVEQYWAALPLMAKAGLSWSVVESRDITMRVMPELDKLLVDMFRDTTGAKPFGQKLGDEWKDVRKAVGFEATAFDLVSLRLGYFEYLTSQRGGIVLEKEGQTYHYGVWDVLARKNLGKLKCVGLCWGIGIGSDALRFDLSSDAAIYDFPTKNWKLQLTCNDIGRLF